MTHHRNRLWSSAARQLLLLASVAWGVSEFIALQRARWASRQLRG